MPLAVVILALVVAGAVVGGASVLGAPVLAVPILALLLAGWAVTAVGRRALLGRPARERRPIEFSAEDRATMVPSPSPEQRRRNRRETARHVARRSG
jgi:hypothetical protein